MTSSRPSQPQRRPLAPVSTPTRRNVTVEEWEVKAPLGDLELRSISALKAANEKIPLPLRFTAQEEGAAEGSMSSQPGTPLAAKFPTTASMSSGSRPDTPVSAAKVQSHALHPKAPVTSPEEFYDWFALIDRSVAHSQEAHFRAHVQSLSEHLQVCEGLLNMIDEVNDALAKMYEEWYRVEERGRVVEEGCEKVIEERDRLMQAIDDIGEQMEYFQELEKAVRLLNYPGESLIFEPDFLYMVERVDVCIMFLKAHRHYREAEVYLLRFQQCMTRAMTLIRMSFVGSLRALTADISRRLSEQNISQTAQHHLLYTRFLSVAPKIQPLLHELESRVSQPSYHDDLSALLDECYHAYFNARRSLLLGWVQEEVRALNVGGGDLVELTRAGCSFLKQLCTDEFNLYNSFFSTAEEQLYQYLEKLCDVLYDDLRPRILHEQRLTALCEVCTVLQALMVLDSSTFMSSSISSPKDSSGDEDENDTLTVELDSLEWQKGKKQSNRLHISRLLQMVLQDAQTRLFFKAQAMIQSDVRNYAPRAEDLKWPEILIEAHKSNNAGKPQLSLPSVNEKASVSQVALGGLPQDSLLRDRTTWYPTVSKMVWVLEQLREFVQPAIFEDIAQEAIQLCHQSLITASENIKARKGVLDAELFLLRHLLILKEVIAGFELTDGAGGSGTTGGYSNTNPIDTLASLLSRTTGLIPLPEALFNTLGVGGIGVHGERGDLRYKIDQALRKACGNVIYECTSVASRVLHPWLSPSSTFLSSPTQQSTISSGVSGSSGSVQPSTSAPPNRLPPSQTDALLRESCIRDLRSALIKMKLYLDSGEAGMGSGTVGVLVHHVRERVVEAYKEFLDVVTNESGSDTESEGLKLMGIVKLGELLRDIIAGMDTDVFVA